MIISIIGYGYVGKAFDNFFNKHHKVFIYDIKKIDSQRYSNQIKKSDLYVVCVSTNKNPDGSVNMDGINDSFEKINSVDSSAFVLLKSTVPPETTDKLLEKYNKMHICFSPEYIGESSYYIGSPYDWSTEVIKTPFFIFGGKKDDTSRLVSIFQEIAGPNKNYIQVSSKEAEVTKYMENTFFASKIIFCNEFYNICDAFGVDYNTVRELWLADTRINKNHTIIMNKEEPFCFGGKCLPKDLAGIIYHSEKRGYNPRFLKAVQASNTKTSGVYMFHRIAMENTFIPSIYNARKMVSSIYELEDFVNRLLENGKEFGTLEQALNNKEKYFVLTFDDGYSEHLKVAEYFSKHFNAPKHSLLFSITTDFMENKSFGMDAFYYLATEKKLDSALQYFSMESFSKSPILMQIAELKKKYLTLNSLQLQEFADNFRNLLPENIYLNRNEIKLLASYGTICSHGKSHRNLTFGENSETEITESKKLLSDLTGNEINIFCYPEGKYNENLVKIVGKEYKFAMSINGENDNLTIVRTNGSL